MSSPNDGMSWKNNHLDENDDSIFNEISDRREKSPRKSPPPRDSNTPISSPQPIDKNNNISALQKLTQIKIATNSQNNIGNETSRTKMNTETDVNKSSFHKNDQSSDVGLTKVPSSQTPPAIVVEESSPESSSHSSSDNDSKRNGSHNKNRKQRISKKQLQEDLSEVKNRLKLEQELSEHLRKKIEKEIMDRGFVEAKLEESKYRHDVSEDDNERLRKLSTDNSDERVTKLQTELDKLEADYLSQQEKHVECLETLKELQDSYAEMKTVTLENYKLEVDQLKKKLANAEEDQNLVESLRRDALDSHLLLEQLKEAHRNDVNRVVAECTEEKQQLQLDNQNLSATLAALQHEVEAMKTVMNQTEVILADKDGKIQKLKEEFENINSRSQSMEVDLKEKTELISDLRQQLIREAEFVTKEREMRIQKETEVEALNGVKHEKEKVEEEAEELKNQVKMKHLKIKFVKKQLKDSTVQKDKAESVMVVIPEQQRKIGELEAEVKRLQRSIDDRERERKEKIAREEFEQKENEEKARKQKEDWERNMLGIGRGPNEITSDDPLQTSLNSTLNDSFRRPQSAPLFKPNPPRKYTRIQSGKLRKPPSINPTFISNFFDARSDKARVHAFTNTNDSLFTSSHQNNTGLLSHTHRKHKRSPHKLTREVQAQSKVLVMGSGEEKRLLAVGDRVSAKVNCNCESHSETSGPNEHMGTVRFIGFIQGNDCDVYIGLQMDETIGNTDGTAGGKRYFRCDPRCGRFVHLDNIRKLNPIGSPRSLPAALQTF